MKESDVDRALQRAVAEAGGLTRRVQWIGRRGAPDRLVLLPGMVVWVETKAPQGGRLAAAQAREIERLRWAGQHAVVASTPEGVYEAVLDGLLYGLGPVRPL